MQQSIRFFIAFTLLFTNNLSVAQEVEKPIVWIYTDMSDKNIPGPNKEGTLNDPDDISAMAGYLLMANRFDTRGIVVASTHRGGHATSPNQAKWADASFEAAYRKDLPMLQRHLGGFPNGFHWLQSGIKRTGERYAPDADYRNLEGYPTVQALLDEVNINVDTINVLCWGSLTEPAILVKHCLNTGRKDLLGRLRFIAHWTNSPWRQGSPEQPEDVANCRDDAAACAYKKERAAVNDLVFYELGAIGQHGIVSGSPHEAAFYEQFRTSALGTIFVEGKFVNNSVDHSDAATYWTLLGEHGVSLTDIAADGTNDPETERMNEATFRKRSPEIMYELLRRSKIAGHGPGNGYRSIPGVIHHPDALPDYLIQLTDFGERAAWSPDGKRLAFIAKTYGDAYEIDLATRKVRPLTHHFPHYGFQRVQYLSNGDYLLTGADFYDKENPGRARKPENAEVWILDRELKRAPTALGINLKEGIAISRNTPRICWVIDPEMMVADIVYEDGIPRIANQKVVLTQSDLPAPVNGWRLEPQDFRPPLENELIFNAHFPKIVHESESMGLDLTTGEIRSYSQREDLYDEPEGIFPDGEHLLVESNRHRPRYKDLMSWNLIDLYRLRLDGSGDMLRLTYFNDHENYKASNPVVSPDGRYIAFQWARLTETTGVGHGIMLMDLDAFSRLHKLD